MTDIRRRNPMRHSKEMNRLANLTDIQTMSKTGYRINGVRTSIVQSDRAPDTDLDIPG